MLAEPRVASSVDAFDATSHPNFDGHETVAVHSSDGLHAIIAVHNTNLGPGTGGCRMYPYASFDDALTDVLRLSRGMTYKSAMAGIGLGGGKSVIIADPARDKNRELLLAMGDFIDSLGGCYVAAEDSGTTVADMKVIAERTSCVSGFIATEQHRGDPSPMTALGVYLGMEQALRQLGVDSLEGVRVAIQGVGNVGLHLARMLWQADADVLVADANPARVRAAVDQLGVRACGTDEILCADVDVLAPCALGSVIHSGNVDKLKAKVIAGAANNQLATEDLGEALRQQGILYAPDYVINGGGIIDIHYQRLGQRDPQQIRSHLDVIPRNLETIFARSEAENRATNEIADEMAREKFTGPELTGL